MRLALEALVAAALVAVGALGYRHCAGQLAAEREARRAAEQEVLEADGQLVAHRVEADVLEHDRDQVAAAFPAVEARLRELAHRAPGSRVTSAAQLTTGPVIVPEPRPAQGGEPSPFRPAEGRCLLAPGDRTELRTGQVTQETREGNQVLLAAGICVRVEPAPETTLAEGELRGVWHVPVTPAPASSCNWGTLAAACAVCGGVGMAGGAWAGSRR